MLRILRQTLHILLLLFAAHRVRPRDGLLVSIGFIIASAALVVILSIPVGIERLSGNTGQADIVVVLSGNVLDEASSALSPEQVALVSQFPQVARDQAGQPLVAAQFLTHLRLVRADGQPAMVVVRGVSADVWKLLDPEQLRADVRIREGSRQLLASRTLAQQFAELQQPDMAFRGRDWEVAGSLDANGNLWESELWTDLSALQAAYNRPGGISSLWLKLASPDQGAALMAAIRSDPRLDGIRIERQTDYYQRQVGFVADFVRAAALGIALLLGLGAALVISAMLNIALENRRIPMGILRSLGFDGRAVLFAAVLDVVCIGVVCALVAAGAAWCVLDGASFGTSNYDQAVYAYFVVDFNVVALVIAYALILGLVSSIFPLRKITRGRLLAALQE